jgi:hypothetical protein
MGATVELLSCCAEYGMLRTLLYGVQSTAFPGIVQTMEGFVQLHACFLFSFCV